MAIFTPIIQSVQPEDFVLFVWLGFIEPLLYGLLTNPIGCEVNIGSLHSDNSANEILLTQSRLSFRAIRGREGERRARNRFRVVRDTI